ncbi:hypothetical protein DW987_07555 [Ruminococcus sp. AM50-15BH]|nr:hypothetical protein DW987_07555 [Ruminococcus sp. AM50-15BH]
MRTLYHLNICFTTEIVKQFKNIHQICNYVPLYSKIFIAIPYTNAIETVRQNTKDKKDICRHADAGENV